MIKGLSEIRRCPRLGHIRLGIKAISEKTQKEYPKEVDYFILDPETGDQQRNEELKAQFKELYGEKPTAIKIMFPPVGPEIFFAQWFKRYGSGTLLKCKGGEDGTAVCALPEFAEGLEIIGKDEMGLTKVKCLGEECIYQKDKSCRRLGALQVLLPELDGVGVWQINTSSWNSIVNLNSALDWLRGLCGRFAMIPIILRRVPTEIAYEGTKSKHYIMQIDIENVNIAQLQQAALIAPEKSAISMLPAPDEKKDELLYPEKNGNGDDKETGGAPAALKPRPSTGGPGAKEKIEDAEIIDPDKEFGPSTKENGIFAKPQQLETLKKLFKNLGWKNEDIKFKIEGALQQKFKAKTVDELLKNLTEGQAGFLIIKFQTKK